MSVAPDEVPLEQELASVDDRVNVLPSVVVERAAALRWSLERVDENRCDAYATAASPAPLQADVPIEAKAVRVTHNGGARLGRVGIHYGTHVELLEAGGWYAIGLYREIDVDDDRAILVRDLALVPADEVDRWLSAEGAEYRKVRWELLLEVDREDVLGEWGGSR